MAKLTSTFFYKSPAGLPFGVNLTLERWEDPPKGTHRKVGTVTAYIPPGTRRQCPPGSKFQYFLADVIVDGEPMQMEVYADMIKLRRYGRGDNVSSRRESPRASAHA